jgi:hypothetical protein
LEKYPLHFVCVAVSLSDKDYFVVDSKHSFVEIVNKRFQLFSLLEEKDAALTVPSGRRTNSSQVHFEVLELIRVVPIANDLDVWEKIFEHLSQLIEFSSEFLL